MAVEIALCLADIRQEKEEVEVCCNKFSNQHFVYSEDIGYYLDKACASFF